MVNIFQNRQEIKSSGTRNLRIGKFVMVRKLRNTKLILRLRRNSLRQLDIPWLLRLLFSLFCISINLERPGFLSHIVTLEMPKYLKGLIFTQVQCCFSWEHSFLPLI